MDIESRQSHMSQVARQPVNRVVDCSIGGLNRPKPTRELEGKTLFDDHSHIDRARPCNLLPLNTRENPTNRSFFDAEIDHCYLVDGSPPPGVSRK